MIYNYIKPVAEAHRIGFAPSDYKTLIATADRTLEFTPMTYEKLNEIAGEGQYVFRAVMTSRDFKDYVARVEIDFRSGDAAMAFMRWADEQVA